MTLFISSLARVTIGQFCLSSQSTSCMHAIAEQEWKKRILVSSHATGKINTISERLHLLQMRGRNHSSLCEGAGH
jgi:hypothetical protein